MFALPKEKFAHRKEIVRSPPPRPEQLPPIPQICTTTSDFRFSTAPFPKDAFSSLMLEISPYGPWKNIHRSPFRGRSCPPVPVREAPRSPRKYVRLFGKIMRPDPEVLLRKIRALKK
jgi:hypothetical protein